MRTGEQTEPQLEGSRARARKSPGAGCALDTSGFQQTSLNELTLGKTGPGARHQGRVGGVGW